MAFYSGAFCGGFEFGDAGDEDSPKVGLRRGGEVASSVEPVECEAKLFKGVARSCRDWFPEDHSGLGVLVGSGNAADSNTLFVRRAGSSSAMRRRR